MSIKDWFKSIDDKGLSAYNAGKSLLSSAASILSTLSTYKQDKNYYSYQRAQANSVLDNYVNSVDSLSSRYLQEQEASSNNLLNSYLANLQNKAIAQNSGIGSGVEGNSLDMLYSGYDRANAINNYTAARNLQLSGLQYNREIEGYRARALSSINELNQPAKKTTANTVKTLGSVLTQFLSTDFSSKKNELNMSYLDIDGLKVDSNFNIG